MSDNLKVLKQNLDNAIDPNAGIGQILAQDHNDVITEFINKSGKYAGLTYKAVSDGANGVIPIGIFSWNGNAMNQTGTFILSLSTKTTDLNIVTPLFDNLIEDDLIKFKDFVGRSVLLKYKSHTIGQDTSNNDIVLLSVESLPGNVNYTYQPTENEPCVLDFYQKSGDSDWLKTDNSKPTTVNDAIYTKGDVYIGDVVPVSQGTSNTGNLQVDGELTIKDRIFIGNRHSVWGVSIQSETSQNGAINFVARGNNVANPGFNFEQQGNFGWTFWNDLSQQLLKMTQQLVHIFKPLRLSNIPSGTISDEILTVDSSGNVRKTVLPEAYEPFPYKDSGTGYYEIKIPFVNTNFSIKFSVYRHGNGLEQYHVTGYLSSPNGWIQTYVTKTSQSSNATETITLTDNGNAGDFRIYIGNGTLSRNITTLFITEALQPNIGGSSSSISSLNNFPTSIQSSITGTVRGTF